MKKDLKTRKLSLTTETLKTLSPDALDRANGGIAWTVIPVVTITVLFCDVKDAR